MYSSHHMWYYFLSHGAGAGDQDHIFVRGKAKSGPMPGHLWLPNLVLLGPYLTDYTEPNLGMCVRGEGGTVFAAH